MDYGGHVRRGYKPLPEALPRIRIGHELHEAERRKFYRIGRLLKGTDAARTPALPHVFTEKLRVESVEVPLLARYSKNQISWLDQP